PAVEGRPMSADIQKSSNEWALPRGVIVLLGGAGIVISLAGLKAMSDIVAPTFLALMLTLAVSPLGTWLRKKGAPGWVAMLATMAAAFSILIGFAVGLAYAGVRLAALLPTYTDNANNLTTDLMDWLTSVGVDQQQIDAAVSNVQLSDFSGVLIEAANAITGVFSSLFFICILLFFMSLDLAAFNSRLAISERLRPDIGAAFESFVYGTRRYLIVATIFGFIVAVMESVALWALGIPLVVVWGIVSFITNYIPNVGFVLGVIPPALIGLLQGGLDLMVAVIVVYSVINFVIQSLIQPKIVGDTVGLATTITFLSMVVWAWVIGPLGALLAVPLTLLAKALLIDIDPSTQWIGILIGGSKPEADEEDDADTAAPELAT
ncbi:MAG: AI-2E family transporter, partial [Candidatus Nanopelagicales bacterium]